MGEISSCCCISSSCSSNTSPQAAAEAALQRVGSGVSAVSSEVEESESISRVNKLPSSQFKGVVPQPNGRWGAQIYEKHRRVWLGTFNLERDAAWAYDLAAQRFRGRDAVTNFPPLTHSSSSSRELSFLLSRSKAEVVDMLRKHTYLDELQRCPPLPCGRSRRAQACSHARELLFDKAVTPSDVGKLNRLVIPKQHAEKHFPIPEGAKGLLLSFEDGGKIWRFRYSYWNSSQSYVLTKGWSRFVKEKALLPGDSVAFYRSKPGSDRKLYIECRPRLRIVVLRLFGVDISVLGQAPTAEIKRKLCCVSVDAAADSCLLKKPRIGS